MKKNHVCSICRKCPRKTHIHWFVKSFLSEQFLFAVLVFIPNTKNLYSSSIKICWLRLFPSTFQNYQRKKVRFPAYNERAFHTPEPFVSAVWAERFVGDRKLKISQFRKETFEIVIPVYRPQPAIIRGILVSKRLKPFF